MKDHGIRDSEGVRNAAILFALDNPNVNSAILTFLNFEEVDRLLKLSGNRFSKKENRRFAHRGHTPA